MNPWASVVFSHFFLAAVPAVSQIVTFAQSPIEDFSKEKVGMVGIPAVTGVERFFLVSRVEFDPVSRHSSSLMKRSRVVKIPTVMFQNGLPKLFVSLPDWVHTYAAQAYDIDEDGTSSSFQLSLHLETRLTVVVISVSKTALAACTEIFTK